MTTTVEIPAAKEGQIVQGGKPVWARADRPGQKFMGTALLPDEKGKPTVYDLYLYGDAEAVGLRYGNHPRDEHTHAVEYWKRLHDPMSTALVKTLRGWAKPKSEKKTEEVAPQ